MRAINSTCIYGVSGVGKTSQIEDFAIYVKRKTGKITRLIGCDPAGWEPLNPAIEEGLIVPTYIVSRVDTLFTMDKLTKGWWPADPKDPASKLLPPASQKDWEGVGGIALEGMTSIGNWHLEDLTKIAANNQSIKFWGRGEEAPVLIQQGGEKFGNALGGMYGMVQARVRQFVVNSNAIPDKYVLWTALEDRGKDDDHGKMPVYGPATVGHAVTYECSYWFNNLLHLAFKDIGKGDLTRRLWFEQHTMPPDPVPYLAKGSTNKRFSLVKEVKQQFLEGEKANIGVFLELLDSIKDRRREELRKEVA